MMCGPRRGPGQPGCGTMHILPLLLCRTVAHALCGKLDESRSASPSRILPALVDYRRERPRCALEIEGATAARHTRPLDQLQSSDNRIVLVAAGLAIPHDAIMSVAAVDPRAGAIVSWPLGELRSKCDPGRTGRYLRRRAAPCAADGGGGVASCRGIFRGTIARAEELTLHGPALADDRSPRSPER